MYLVNHPHRPTQATFWFSKNLNAINVYSICFLCDSSLNSSHWSEKPFEMIMSRVSDQQTNVHQAHTFLFSVYKLDYITAEETTAEEIISDVTLDNLKFIWNSSNSWCLLGTRWSFSFWIFFTVTSPQEVWLGGESSPACNPPVSN